MNQPPSISHEQVAELKEAFRSFDKDDRGLLGLKELMNVLKTLGRHPHCEEEGKFLKDILPEGIDSMDFPTFTTLMGQSFGTSKMEDLLSDCVKSLSKQSGKDLSAKEVENLLTTKGRPLEISQNCEEESGESEGCTMPQILKRFQL